MDIKIFILVLLSVIPILSKYFFWLYTIQLKEYRLDRFQEYLSTPQWKKALYNWLLLIEIPILIFSIWYFIDKAFWYVLYNVLFALLAIETIFYLIKFLKNKLYFPKITSRIKMTIINIIIIQTIIFIALNNIYFFIMLNLAFNFIYIFFSIFLSLPLVNKLKNKKINLAMLVSTIKNKPIKIWITWSYWKSSVKNYLKQILYNDWKTLSTPKNINTELWVSDLIINNLKNKYKYFVAEMWAYKIWEIKQLWEIVDHKYGFLTAVWNQHLALFWWIQNTIKWKTEIALKVLKNDWILYANFDNKYIRKHKFESNLNLVSYWLEKKADAKTEIIEETIDKTKFKFHYKWKSHTYSTNLIWKHNILNLTWILAFCYDLEIDNKIIKKSLKSLEWDEVSLKIIQQTENVIIDDSYNLSEWWLFSWLEVLNKFKTKKSRILIIDDILELGKDSKEIHYNIGKKIAREKLIDKVFYVWVNYKKDFVKWLIKWWIWTNNIIKDIKEIGKKDNILLEWRKAWVFLKKLVWEE